LGSSGALAANITAASTAECAGAGFSCVAAVRPDLRPLSYTHRHRCELARALGGSRALGRFPPRRFVWEILKIDSRLTTRPRVRDLVYKPDHGVSEAAGGPR
jgi:hypothetical protein